jgi:predicted transposase/invertase (TIGR01784 family)
LLLFVERILHLKDKELERLYVEYREQLSREGKIVYIRMGEREEAAEIERRGMEKGIEKGIEKGKLELARNLLTNGVSPDIIAKSADLPLEKVRALMN